MLATRTERARERVLEAAAKLRAAREAARTAASRATEARGAATAAHARAALDPSSALGGPLLTEAGMAEDAAQRAEAHSADAQAELDRVTRWAEHEARDAVQDAERADRQAASELESARGLGDRRGRRGAFATARGGRRRAAAPPGRLPRRRPLQLLVGRPRPRRSRSASSRRAARSSTAPRSTCGRPRRGELGPRRPRRGGRASPLRRRSAHGGAARLQQRLPRQGCRPGPLRHPGESGAGSWLSDASKATPVFRRLGIAGGVFSTRWTTKHLVEQGNPVDAFKRTGRATWPTSDAPPSARRARLSSIAPNPVTGGAVIVSGAVWAGAEAWDHREEIAGAVSSGADWAFDHSAAGAVWNNREEIGAALDSGVDTAKDIGGGALDAGGDVLDAGGDLLDKVPTPW